MRHVDDVQYSSMLQNIFNNTFIQDDENILQTCLLSKLKIKSF
jgi:hypothetical protein